MGGWVGWVEWKGGLGRWRNKGVQTKVVRKKWIENEKVGGWVGGWEGEERTYLGPRPGSAPGS